MVQSHSVSLFSSRVKTGKLKPIFGGHRRPFCHSSLLRRILEAVNKYERNKNSLGITRIVMWISSPNSKAEIAYLMITNEITVGIDTSSTQLDIYERSAGQFFNVTNDAQGINICLVLC